MFHCAHKLNVEQLVKLQNRHILLVEHGNIGRLLLLIVGVVDFFVKMFVCCGIFGKRHIFPGRRLVQHAVFDLFEEFLVAHTAVFDEQLHRIPHALVLFALSVKQRIDLIADLFDNVRRNFGNIAIGLQIAA